VKNDFAIKMKDLPKESRMLILLINDIKIQMEKSKYIFWSLVYKKHFTFILVHQSV